jgi:transcriptional regulator with XRE-family HTH domain
MIDRVDEVSPERAQLGAALRLAREQAGLELREVAERLGVSRTLVAAYERGTRGLSALRLGEFCVLYACTPAQLLGLLELGADPEFEAALRHVVTVLPPADREFVVLFARFLLARRGVDSNGG